LANVGESSESQHFPVLGHFVLARLEKFVKTLKKHYFVILASLIFLKNGFGKCRQVKPVLAKLLGECWQVWRISQNCLVSEVSLGNQRKYLKRPFLGMQSIEKKSFFWQVQSNLCTTATLGT
jgi:hypothetical protein